MSKEELIDELSEILKKVCRAKPIEKCAEQRCHRCRAEMVIEAGYRKQNEMHPIPCKIGDKIYEVTGEPGERIDIDEYTVSEVGLNGVFTNGRVLRHRHYFAYEDEGCVVVLQQRGCRGRKEKEG